MSETPITFTEPAWVLFDVDANAVMTAAHGNMAIFSTKGMAEIWAATVSDKNVEVREVSIKPRHN
jgi:hypothetical protein